MAVVIQYGPTGSGKSTRSQEWRKEDPDNRMVFDHYDALPTALYWSRKGQMVVVNITTDETIEAVRSMPVC